MNRKEFLKNAAALGIGVPFLSLLLNSCEKEADLFPSYSGDFSGKVLIIGAGAAGLTAAYVLNRYNIEVEVIEASSVYGGRVKRNTGLADFPIDLGAEWIHEAPSVLARLISDESTSGSIETITYSPDTIYTWSDGNLTKLNLGSNFYSEYKFKDTTWYGFFENYIAPTIADKIIYNSPVTEIDYSGAGVVVRNANGDTFEGDRVLVTVPITILQNNSIQFTPAFSAERIAAINNVDMPDGLKVFIEFSEKFYPDILYFGNPVAGNSDSEEIYYDAAFLKESSKHVLGLFTVGSKASAYTDLGSEAEIMAKVMGDLDTIFEGKASQHYVQHVVQNWRAEPYVQGSYGITYTGSRDEIVSALNAPLDNKVFFAGEVHSVDNWSTVPGAAESAYAAVELILK